MMHPRFEKGTMLEIDWESLDLMLRRVYSAALKQQMVLGDDAMEPKIDKIVTAWEEYGWLKVKE